MGVLTQDMRDVLASAMLAFVATVRRDGSPGAAYALYREPRCRNSTVKPRNIHY